MPEVAGSTDAFAVRIEKDVATLSASLTRVKNFSVFGVGSDGHTAGIFPLSEPAFNEVFVDDRTYVPVQVEGLTIDSRASFTPGWILNYVDEIITYVVGQDKRPILESLIVNQNHCTNVRQRF